MRILLIIVSFFPVRTKPPDPNKAMLYSAVLPGGGQFYNGNYLKGVAFAGLEIFLLGSSYVNYRESLKYANSSLERDFYMKESFSYALYFLGVYLFSIADAYVSANFYKVDKYFSVEKDKSDEKNR